MSTFLFSFGNVEKDKATQALISKRELLTIMASSALLTCLLFSFLKVEKKQICERREITHTLESLSMKVAESARLVEYQLQALLQKKLDT